MPTKIDPWASLDVKDYGRLEKEFGIQSMKPLVKRLPDNPLFRRGIVFGHRDFDKIVKAYEQKKPFAMLTGLMPSGKFHLGHALVAKQIIAFQEMGAEVFLCVADIEAYLMRNQPLGKLRETAVEEYLLNYIALGLKPAKLNFYFQSAYSPDAQKSNAYYRLIGTLAKRPTMNELKAIYGVDLSPAKIQSVLTQMADILHPMLPEFGGVKPVVVPVGVDQDPHIRLARDLAARAAEYKFIPPAATFNKLLPGLKGGKMASSDSQSFIALSDSPKDAAQKIRKYAFSGGAATMEEHRKKGGNPDVDVPYQLLHYLLEPDDKKLQQLHDEYRSGKLLTGELKEYVIDKLTKFLGTHQGNREKARGQLGKYLKE